MYQLNATHDAVLSEPSALRASWRYDANAKINGGLAFANGLIFFDTFAGEVIAVDAASGLVRWKTRTDNVVMSTPVVESGIVVVGTGKNGALGEPPSSLVYDPGHNRDPSEVWGRPEGDHIIGLDADSGRIIWRYRTLGEDMPSPVLTMGSAIFSNGDQHAYAVRLKDGSIEWRDQLDGVSTMASLTYSSGLVLSSACDLARGVDETVAIRVLTGEVWWRLPYGSCDASPTIALGVALLSGVLVDHRTGYGRGVVDALDLRTGTHLWRFMADGTGRFTSMGSNERAIAGSSFGRLYYQSFPTINALVAIDIATGRLVWEFRTAAPVKMSAVAYKGHLFFGDTGGKFYDINASNGSINEMSNFEEGFSVAPPIVVGKTLFMVVGEAVLARPL